MNVDIFFRSAPQSQKRYERAQFCLAEWRKWLPVTVLQANPRESFEFQSRSRMIAEEQSATSIYILADDDMLPATDMEDWRSVLMWVAFGVNVLARYPQFGILSPMLQDTNLGTGSTADDSEPFVDESVMESHNVGGIRFIRKGIVKDWPKQERRGYDQEHCGAMQKLGYRVGYMKNLWAIHPADGSETWKDVTNWECPRL